MAASDEASVEEHEANRIDKAAFPIAPLLEVRVIVDEAAEFHDVIDCAERMGLTQVSRLDLLGTAYGRVDEDNLAILRSVAGIREVRLQEEETLVSRKELPAWMVKVLHPRRRK